jgi:glycosyltransferase involved in cell wall biosynthesis
MTLVINGRFLRSAQPTGMHRVAVELTDAARARGLDAEVLAPPGVSDSRADRRPWAPPGRFGDHAWEQLSLPVAARGRPILSLLNTAPVLPRRAATMVHDLAFNVREWHAAGHGAYGAVVLGAARRAAVVLTPSYTVAGELAEAGIDRHRISVVRPAIDLRWRPHTTTAIDAVRAKFGLERPYCLMVGWQNPRKDVATIVDAHARLVRELPHDLVLVGAGSSTYKPVTLPDLASVRELGYVADDDLAALTSGAAAFVYPSVYEGFGLPVVEAIASGAPTIASDIPVLREATGGAAHFVARGDPGAWIEAIRTALRGELANGEIPAWTWDDAAGQLLDALAPIL